ncbi:MAG: Fur family transcriptional regulator [Flammeovirgaceae bacterium]
MMDQQHVKDRLSAHGIRKTAFRIELLTLFMEHKHSLSHQEIKEKIKSTPDKVTIYRALNAFLKKGLIHKVPDVNNRAKYALCLPESSEKSYGQNHVHFICNTCNHTFCLDGIDIPIVEDTQGFKVKSLKVTVEGECPNCIPVTNQ